MIWLLAAPCGVGVFLAFGSGWLGRRLPPATAAKLLTAAALTVALCTGLILSAVAVLVCAQLGPFPALGHWSASSVRSQLGLPMLVGFAALVVVVVCATAAVRRAVISVATLLSATRAARQFEPLAGGELVIISDEVPVAYSVAGLCRRIVVSTGMMRALPVGERRALLAHERSHLRHRHYLYLHLGRLSAAANPLLRPASAAIGYAVERWADEDSAAEVGDRQLTATALARAALAGGSSASHGGALAAADEGVASRVRRLLAPAPVVSRPTVGLLVAASVVCWAAAIVTTVRADTFMQLAERAATRR